MCNTHALRTYLYKCCPCTFQFHISHCSRAGSVFHSVSKNPLWVAQNFQSMWKGAELLIPLHIPYWPERAVPCMFCILDSVYQKDCEKTIQDVVRNTDGGSVVYPENELNETFCWVHTLLSIVFCRLFPTPVLK